METRKQLGRKRSPEPRKKGSRARIPKAAYDIFCIRYKLTGIAKQSAIDAGFSPNYAAELLANPLIQERLKQVDEKHLQLAIGAALKPYVLEMGFLDEHLAHKIANGKTHPYRGDSDIIHAITTGYKRLGAIEPPRTYINQQQTQSLSGNPNAYEVYEAKWLREKKDRWTKELEAKHVIPATLPE